MAGSSHEKDQHIVRAYTVFTRNTFCDLLTADRGSNEQQEHSQKRGRGKTDLDPYWLDLVLTRMRLPVAIWQTLKLYA